MSNYDDQPVGQHTASGINELPLNNDESAQDLTLNQRLSNKNAKVRYDAACEVLNILNEGKEESNIEVENLGDTLVKLLGDTHPGVQEKALDSFMIVYAKNSSVSNNSEISTVIIDKCLSSPKNTTKSRAMEVLVALSKNSVSIYDAAKTILFSKSSSCKVLTNAIILLTQLIIKYGDSAFPIHDMVPHIVKQAGSTNAAIRNESMEFLKEAHKFLKDKLFPYLAPLKPAQQSDLKKSFSEEVLISSEKSETQSKTEDNAPKDVIPNEAPVSIIPDNASLEEGAVLDKFDDKWCNSVMELKKWSEKRNKLEEVAAATNIPSIKLGNFSELGNMLKQLLNDSNIVVVNLAIRIVGQLSKGLRGYFSIYARHVFPLILQKCKDKKTLSEARKCLENLAFSLKFEDILEEVKESLVDKSPMVKTNICLWLSDVAFLHLTPDQIPIWIKKLAPLLLKLANDAIQDVRTASFSCLGIMKGLAHDPELEKLLGDINSQKQEKISKAAANFESSPMEIGFRKMKSTELLTVRKNSESSLPKPSMSPHLSVHRGNTEEVKDFNQCPVEIFENDKANEIIKNDIEKLIEEKLPAELTNDFDAGSWKERQKKLQDLNEWLNNNSAIDIPLSETLANWLKLKFKDFKESNASVMKEIFAVLNTISNKVDVTKNFAQIIVPKIADKIGDVKLADCCQLLLFSISDSAGPECVSFLVIQTLQSIKSMGIIKAVLNFLTSVVNQYTAKLIPLNTVLDYAKLYYEHKNVQIKSNATELLKVIYSQLGNLAKPLILENFKDNVRRNLELELIGVEMTPSLYINRKLRGVAIQEAEEKMRITTDNMFPRVNITNQLTSSLISDISNKSMKVRQDAKDILDKILDAAKGRITANGLIPLFSALKTRMNEPCKNLAKAYIILVGNLAEAIGPDCKQYTKIILQPLMFNLADKQATIRTETITAINKFSNAIGTGAIFNCAGSLLEKDNPELRSELLSWMYKNKDSMNKADNLSLVKPLISVMQDRSKEIRSLGEKIVGECVCYAGYKKFMAEIKYLKPAVRLSLEAVMEKYRSVIPKYSEGTATEENPMEMMKDLILNKCKNVDRQAHKDPKRRTYKGSEGPSIRDSERLTFTGKNRFSSKDSRLTKKSSNLAAKAKELVIKSNAGRLDSKETERTTYKYSERSTYGSTPYKTISGTLGTQNKKTTVMIDRKSKNLPQHPKISSRRSSRNGPDNNPSNSELPKFAKLNKAGSMNQVLQHDQTEDNSSIEPAIIAALGNKKKRAETDKSMRWPVNEARPNLVDKLKKALAPAMNPIVLEYMFINDIKKTTEVLRVLTSSIKTDFAFVVDILDLLLKWCTMKLIVQSNNAINKGITDFLLLLFTELYQTHYALQEFESASILPILCEKLGVNQTGLRASCIELINKARDLCPVSKIYGYLMMALESSNSKTKSEALSMITELMKAYENQMVIAKDIKTVAKLLDANDNTLKKHAVEYLFEIYKEKKEKFWSLIGSISEGSKKMLKQKFEQPGSANISEKSKGNLETPRSARGRLTVRRSSYNKPLRSKRNSPAQEEFNKIATKTTLIPNNAELLNEKEEEKAPPKEDPYANLNIPEKQNVAKKCIELLKSNNLSKMVDALIIFNTKIRTVLQQNFSILNPFSSDLFYAFAIALKDVFNKPLYAIPWKFCKHVMITLNDLCGFKSLIAEINEKSLFLIMEQLLGKLVYDRLDMRGDNGEGKDIAKAINEAIFKLMENCDPTKTVVILLSIFKKYKDNTLKSDSENPALISGMSINCLIQLCTSMKPLLSLLDTSTILLILHVFMVEDLPNMNSHNKILAVKVTKILLKELVSLHGEGIMETYEQSIGQDHRPDIHIKPWIRALLLPPGTTMKSGPEELKEIFTNLGHQATFMKSISKLKEYISLHPKTDVENYLSLCTSPFKQLVMTLLEECTSNSKEERKDNSDFEEKAKSQFLLQKAGMIKNEQLKDSIDFN